MISKDEVKYIAQLARLGISKEEEDKFSSDLSEILDYMKKLQSVDVKNVVPMSHSLNLENVVREDDIKVSDPKLVKSLINSSPHTEGQYIKVKSIFRESAK